MVVAEPAISPPLQLFLLQLFNEAAKNISDVTINAQENLMMGVRDMTAENFAQITAMQESMETLVKQNAAIVNQGNKMMEKLQKQEESLREQEEMLEKKFAEYSKLLENRFQKQSDFVSEKLDALRKGLSGQDTKTLATSCPGTSNGTTNENYSSTGKRLDEQEILLKNSFLKQSDFMSKRFSDIDKVLAEQNTQTKKDMETFRRVLDTKLQDNSDTVKRKIDEEEKLLQKMNYTLMDEISLLRHIFEHPWYGQNDSLSSIRKELTALSRVERERRLLEAAASGNESTARALLQVGTRMSITDSQSRTPLQIAANKGHVDVIRLLLDYGVNVDQKSTRDDATALHYASIHPDVVYFLLDRGASIEAKSRDGHTPLHWAAFNNGLLKAQALVARGANTKALDNGRRTPLEVARRQNHPALVSYLSQF